MKLLLKGWVGDQTYCIRGGAVVVIAVDGKDWGSVWNCFALG